VDETLVKIGGRWRYVCRAIDGHGQVVDAYLSDHRDAASARAFCERAIAAAGVRPTRVTSDKAQCYPPALRALLPAAEHRSSKYLNNGQERDPQFLKGRVRPMRRFQTTGTASTFCRGHGLIRNLARVLAARGGDAAAPAAGHSLGDARDHALNRPSASGAAATRTLSYISLAQHNPTEPV
jgi:transposase-like protein